jgi:Reverse transcriptase (RNA-dependent DNA polymerase).
MAEINSWGLLRGEQFGFLPVLSTTLQLARLVKRVKRNFEEKRLTDAVFLDVSKAFNSVWIEVLLFKLTFLEFPPYQVKLITSYPHSRTFVAIFHAATSSWSCAGRVITHVLFSLYVNDMLTPSGYIELAKYADDTALVATSKQPPLLSNIWRLTCLNWKYGSENGEFDQCRE